MKIVITGGSDGLGRTIVNKLLEKKHEVILIGRRLENVEIAAKEMGITEYYQCDVTSAEQVADVTSKILAKNDKIDVLINNAGVWVNEAVETDLNKFKNMILVNMFGTVAMTKSFLPRFKEQQSGMIININSQAGVNPEVGSPVYSATKHGMVGYRKSIKQDLGRNNIKITDIHPGMIQTNLFEKAGAQIAGQSFENYSLTKEKVADAVLWAIERPADVAIPAIEIKNIHENFT